MVHLRARIDTNILNYPMLKDSIHYQFPIMITYGQKDIYGKSKKWVVKRFPGATFIEVENAGHIAWKHNREKFFEILDDFYNNGAELNET